MTERDYPAGAGHSVAVGNLDEFRFVDALVRNADPDGKRIIPAGSRLVARGWIFAPDPPRSAARVRIVIGERKFELVASRPRPDIATAFESPSVAACGFHGVVSLDGITTGKHFARVEAAFDDGTTYRLDDEMQFEIVPSRFAFPGKREVEEHAMMVTIDEVVPFIGPERNDDGKIWVDAGNVLVVRGWAVDLAARRGLSGVFAVVDGREYVMGVHGLPREDVADAFSDFSAEARRSGFTVRIPTKYLASGSHFLAISVMASDGVSYRRVDAGRFFVRLSR